MFLAQSLFGVVRSFSPAGHVWLLLVMLILATLIARPPIIPLEIVHTTIRHYLISASLATSKEQLVKHNVVKGHDVLKLKNQAPV